MSRARDRSSVAAYAVAAGVLWAAAAGLGAQAHGPRAERSTAARADFPSWAYPVGAAGAPLTRPTADDSVPQRVPGSRVALSLAQTRDLFVVPDWFRGSTPPMPDIVARGRRPAVYACGYCYLPNGQGHPENATLAGLPAPYIVAQMEEFRSGRRVPGLAVAPVIARSIPPTSTARHHSATSNPLGMQTVYLIANGDSRPAANRTCEAAQAAMERQVVAAVERLDARVERAHQFDAAKGHGFIDSQAMGREVFRAIPKGAPLIVAEAVWQYSQQVLPGLYAHCGPILTVANWSGTWPGLVGLLNLNASLTKAGVAYSSLWSERFDDAFFVGGLERWLRDGRVEHDRSHVRAYRPTDMPDDAQSLGVRVGREFRERQAILGVFDEGCMGMYNAIVPDELLHAVGAFKERLSQSQLYARMRTVGDADAHAVLDWLVAAGMTFRFGDDDATELTRAQVLDQCRMYVAALRLADEHGCDTIGIQYQLGLVDLVPASDLVEGLLNNCERPPVWSVDGARELFAGEALPHFNEVDECAGLDGLITYRLWRELGFPPENTLHDVRWGRHYVGGGAGGAPVDAFVWVFEISGAAPPAHFVGGYRGAVSERQPPMYFRRGGGTLKGVSRPGEIVWSRVYVEGGRLHCDLGLGAVISLPDAETEERWRLTTPQWPIMHAVLRGVSRDQMMAQHKSNHVQVVYAPDRDAARRGLYAKAAALAELGLDVHLCGEA